MTLNWLSIGGRGIDTAFAYDNQAQIGSAIKASGVDRSTLFITTKIMPSPCTQEAALAAVKVDIQQLGLEKLDLVLHHFPCDTDAENEVCRVQHVPSSSVPPLTALLTQAVWAGLVQAKQLGLTRTIGVSHYSVQNLQALMATTPTETPSVNQCQLSVGSHDDATIAFCKSKGITYESFSPLRSVNLADNRLVAVAQAHGVSTAQVALRWVIQLGCPLATSPGENTEYAKEDLGIGNFTLTSAEMSTISAI